MVLCLANLFRMQIPVLGEGTFNSKTILENTIGTGDGTIVQEGVTSKWTRMVWILKDLTL